MKPPFDPTFSSRPLSWSQISSFYYNPEEWYSRYVLNEKQPSSREMEFGKKVGLKLEKDPTYLPQIPRYSKMEHGWTFVYKGIHMTGFADTFCNITNKKLGEFKTGKKEWTQKRVEEHGQLTMYCLGNFITNKIKPEDVDIFLAWMPTQDNGDFTISFVEPIEKNIKIFKTKRTTIQMLKFIQYILDTVKQMQDYYDKHE